jgi:hypothetical protein
LIQIHYLAKNARLLFSTMAYLRFLFFCHMTLSLDPIALWLSSYPTRTKFLVKFNLFYTSYQENWLDRPGFNSRNKQKIVYSWDRASLDTHRKEQPHPPYTKRSNKHRQIRHVEYNITPVEYYPRERDLVTHILCVQIAVRHHPNTHNPARNRKLLNT